jgi:hypothetical protein
MEGIEQGHLTGTSRFNAFDEGLHQAAFCSAAWSLPTQDENGRAE